MELEQALREQSPSLTLQRAAADKIAELRKDRSEAYTVGYQAARAELKECMEYELRGWGSSAQDEFRRPVMWAFAGVLDQLGVSTDGILTDREAQLREISRREF